MDLKKEIKLSDLLPKKKAGKKADENRPWMIGLDRS